MNDVVSTEGGSSWRDSVALLRASAGLGALAWLTTRMFLDLDLIRSTLILGLCTVVPLSLSLLPRGAGASLFGWMSVLEPLASLGAGYALVLEPRAAAALFTLPWFVFTCLALGLGVVRGRAPDRARSEFGWVAGLALLPVGGGWLFLSRAGLDPLHSGSLTVLLTVIHFHFAAFAALAVVACTARVLERGVEKRVVQPGMLKLVPVIVLTMVIGILLVSTGIMGIKVLGLLGAAAMTAALFTHASLTLFYAQRLISSWLPRSLLIISGLSVLMSMPLSLAWAWGQLTTPLVQLEWMLRIHGMANAHGFVFAGLLGFWLQARREPG